MFQICSDVIFFRHQQIIEIHETIGNGIYKYEGDVMFDDFTMIPRSVSLREERENMWEDENTLSF